MISVCLQGKPFKITIIQFCAPTTDAEEAEVDQFCEDQRPSRTNNKKKRDVLSIIGDWNAKVGSQEIPGVTGQSGPGLQNEAGQRLTVLSTEHNNHSKYPFTTTLETTPHVDITKWMVSIKIRSITFFAAEDEETL